MDMMGLFIILLRFGAHRAKASQLMAAHNEWIQRGFSDGVFLLVGSLHPALGGMMFARDKSRSAVQARVDDDPFVAEGVVDAEILHINPSRADARLDFLLDRQPRQSST